MKPPIDLSPLHPVFQQALAPFVLRPIDPEAVAFHVANDARALKLQMADVRPVLDSGIAA